MRNGESPAPLKLVDHRFERDGFAAFTLCDRFEKHPLRLCVGFERLLSLGKQDSDRRSFRELRFRQLYPSIDHTTRGLLAYADCNHSSARRVAELPRSSDSLGQARPVQTIACKSPSCAVNLLRSRCNAQDHGSKLEDEGSKLATEGSKLEHEALI